MIVACLLRATPQSTNAFSIIDCARSMRARRGCDTSRFLAENRLVKKKKPKMQNRFQIRDSTGGRTILQHT